MYNMTNNKYIVQDEMFPISFHDIEFYWETMGLYFFIIEILVFLL